MSIYPNTILVTLLDSEPFILLQTYDEKHGKSQRLYLRKDTLMNQLGDDAEGSITEMDLLNVCTVNRVGSSIRFNVLWLHGNYSDDVSGFQQVLFVPIDKVAKVLSGEKVKHLSYSPAQMPKASIFFTRTAHKAIAEADKLKLHAIRRFFRDNFCYGRDEHLVVQQDEWVKGFFFFSTVSRYEGGVCLHSTEVKGKDGKLYPKLYFGLHT